ncbi:MAG: signal recognition particle-docking protein FtsY, partial [Fluviibacter sp.]
MSDATDNQPRRSWRERLFAGLTKTRQQIGGSVRSLFARGQVDDELLEELEALLLSADVGVEATVILIEDLRQRARKQNLHTAESIQAAMVDCLTDLLQPLEAPLKITPPPGSPFVIMVAGINGAGKTTTLGKLAHHFQAAGHSVLLAAGDTFRAAAREQLQAWGERNNVTVIAQEGGDPSAVIFDAVHAAKARGIDIVLADTAGRLPTQMHLMDEIAKIRRVITKAEETAPHEVLLVLDGTIGQNAIGQVKAFDKAIDVTGLVITKLDGSAKGGVIAAIAKQCPKPVRYIGVGEQVEDLQP